MSDLILCYEQNCNAVQKYGENSREFMKKDGPHGGHKIAYFDDLCDSFIQKQDKEMKKQDYNSILKDVENSFDTFKKDILVKIDLHSKNLIKSIQSIINDDKVVLLYLSTIQRDVQKIKQCSDIFYLFDQPDTINKVYLKSMNEIRQKLKNSSTQMNIILASLQNFKINEHMNINTNQIEQTIIQRSQTPSGLMSEAGFRSLRQSFKHAISSSQQAMVEKDGLIKTLQISQKILQEDLQVSQQTLMQRDSMINAQKVQFKEPTQKEIYSLTSTKLQIFSFSPQYKRPTITINSPNLATKTGATGYDIAAMRPALDQTMGRSVTFGFKIKAIKSDAWIAVGMCHLDTIIQKDFQFNDQTKLGHGCYMISSNRCINYQQIQIHFLPLIVKKMVNRIRSNLLTMMQFIVLSIQLISLQHLSKLQYNNCLQKQVKQVLCVKLCFNLIIITSLCLPQSNQQLGRVYSTGPDQ